MPRLALESPARFDTTETALQLHCFLRSNVTDQLLDDIIWKSRAAEQNLEGTPYVCRFRQERSPMPCQPTACGIASGTMISHNGPSYLASRYRRA